MLAWARHRGASGPSDIRIAASANGTWRSRDLATLGVRNGSPDVFTASHTTFVVWTRDGHVVVADNGGGAFRSHTFTGAGKDPSVSASAGRLFVAFSAGGKARPFLAERNGTAWSGAFVWSPNGAALRVVSRLGRATVLATTPVRVYARTQR